MKLKCHEHEAEVRQAIYDELERWRKLGGFKRTNRATANNVVDSRWVLKWKSVDGKRIIKARLTVRGYKDQQAEQLQTYAGTATRWSQRIVNFMVVQKGWRLFSADVGQAFLRGLSFKQIQEMDGEVHRDVQFTVPPGSVPILQKLTGYADFDPIREVLSMLRAGF